METIIDIRDIEAVRVAYMKYQGVVLEANKVFPNVFKSVRGKTSGAPFFSYLTMNPKTGLGELELCVPTEETPDGQGVETKVIPGFRAICMTHVGPYETLKDAYAAIDEYARNHNLKLGRPFREVFIKGPGMLLKGNPEKYITEIQIPIQEV